MAFSAWACASVDRAAGGAFQSTCSAIALLHHTLSRCAPLLRARSSRRILAASVGALLASITLSPAVTNVYEGGSTWAGTAAWSLGHVPTTTDALFFDHSIINPMVSSGLNASFTAQTLSFNTGADALGIDANASGATAQTLTLTGGTNANGGADLISLSATTTGAITLGGTAGVGTLTVAFGAVTGTINVANASANLIFGANSLITGTAGLTKSGAGTLQILSSNSYTGVTTINAGVLSVATLANGGTASGIGNSTNAAANLVINGGTLQYTGGVQSTDRLFTLGASGGTLDASGNGLLTFANTGAMVFSGANTARTFTLAGSGSGSFSPVIGDDGAGATTLSKTGVGSWTVQGANTYTGGTNLHAGTLSLGSSGALGSTGPITFTGGALQFTGSNTTDYSVRFSTAASQAYSIDTNGQTLTFAAALTSSGGSLTMLGAGTLTLSGANTYDGGTNLHAGTLSLGSSGALGSTGPITFTGGTLQYTGSNTTDYSVRFSTAASQAYSIDTNGQTLTFATALTSSGGSLTKLGAGALTLSAANSYTGGTTISGGALFLGNGGATGALSASGAITDNGNLTFNRSNTLTQGTDFGIITGSGSVTQGGSGTVIFSAANVYAGGTNLNAGTLRLGSSGALGATGTISFGGGALQYTAANTTDYSARFSTADGQAYNIDTNGQAVTFTTALTSSGGSLTMLGAGALTLSSANTYDGGTNLHAGTLSLGSSGALGNTGPITFTGGALQYTAASASADYASRITDSSSPITIDTNGQMVTFASTLGSGNFGGLTKLGAGTLNIAAAASYGGSTNINAGALLVSSGGSLNTNGYTVTVQSGTTLTVDGVGSSFSGPVSIGSNGSAALNLQNGAVINSTSLNLFAAGSLNIGGATAGQFTGGTLNASVQGTTGSVINFNQSDPSYTFAAQITGNVAVHVNGPGATVFTASGGYTGTTTIASGSTLNLTGTHGPGNIVDNGALSFSAGTASVNSVISGSGSVQQNGPGTVTFSGISANAYSGGTTVATGATLIFSNHGSAGAGAIVDNGTVVLNSTATFSSISGPGDVQMSNGGTATLAGNNTYTGETTVTGGTLSVTGAVNGTSAVTVDTGGILSLAMTGGKSFSVSSLTVGINGAGSIGIGGVLMTSQATIGSAPGANGTATLVLGWNNTGDLYVGNNGGTGTLNFNDGTLNVGGTIYVGANGGTGILNANAQLHQFGAAAIGIAGGNGTMTIGNGTWNDGFVADVGDGGTGTFTITGGAFVVGASTNVGSSGGNGTMTVNGTGTRWNGNGLSIGVSNGTGVLNIQNGATVTTAVVNGTTGAIIAGQLRATFLDNGTLNIGAFGGGTTAGTLIAGEVIGSDASVVNFNQTDGSYTFAPAITGAIVVNQNSPGTTILTGANTYSGGANLNAGTLNLGSSTALGTAGAITFGGGTLQFSAVNATDYSASFSTAANQAYSLDTNGQTVTLATALTSAGGSLTKNGAGLLILTGANTYTGATTIGADTLQLGNGGTTGSLSASSGIINNGGLVFNRSDTLVQGTDFGTISGSGSITQAGAGTTVLTAANSYTGSTNLNGGMLSLGSSGALGSTGAISFGGGTLQFTAANTTDYSALFSTADGQTYSIDTNGQNVTLATALTSSGGSLAKLGAGALTLTVANTYTGATKVAGGTLIVSGSLSGTASVTVGDGTNPATLGGNGTITPSNGGTFTVTNAATLAPSIGSSTGLTINSSGAASLLFQSGSTLQLSMANNQAGSLGAPALGDYSQLTIGAGVSVTLAGNIITSFDGGMNNGDLFTIILNSGSITGIFDNTPAAAPDSAGSTYRFTSNGLEWDINYAWNGNIPLANQDVTNFEQTTGGNNVALLLLTVPEPGTWASLLAGGALLLGWRRRRKA